MTFKKKLIYLEQLLKEIQAPILTYLNRGLSEQEIKDAFQTINLVPSKDLVEFYMWKNGINDDGLMSGQVWFGPRGHFYPLIDSINEYKLAIEDEIYENRFFPLFSQDSFLIDMSKKSKDYNKIFIYCPALTILEPQSCYDSLDKMIETIIVLFEKKVFWYDENGFFHHNSNMSWDISKKINPKSLYWK